MPTTKVKEIKKVNNVSLEKPTEFKFLFNQLNAVTFHCNVLEDFLYAPFLSLRKLHKNYEICKDLLEKIGQEAAALNKRQNDLNQKWAESQANAQLEDMIWEEPEDLKKVRIDHNAAIEQFNTREFKVNLFTVLDSDFPQDRSKFEKKSIDMGQMQSREVDTYTSYNGLLGTIITETISL